MNIARLGPYRRVATAFGAAAAVFLTLDAVWLTVMVDRLYRPAIGHLMREDFDVIAAAAFYVLYCLGMVALAILPASRARDGCARGALLGLVTYATYDLTNQATMRDWPWHVTGLDLLWGVFVTSTSAAAATWLLTRRR